MKPKSEPQQVEMPLPGQQEGAGLSKEGSPLPWNVQNAGFIAAYNKKIEEEGLALQEWRAF